MSIESVVSSSGYTLLKLALDAANLRQQVVANNIANASTQGYQPMRVSFEDRLALESTRMHSGSGVLSGLPTPTIEIDSAHAKVSIENEMVQMTKNFIHYQAVLKAVNGKYDLIGLALNDGRR
jgi:flagellar basal-body rod protein FlgB